MALEAGVKSTLSLKELLARRSSIKGQITKFKNYIDKVTKSADLSNMELAELTLKLSKFEGLSTKFDDLQTEIEVLNVQNIQVELDERERIEHDIIQLIAISKTLIQEYNQALDNENSKRRQSMANADTDHQQVNFKLPQIQVSKFDGSYFRWLEFRDTFLSLVHKNDRIADIHKFHYLLSYLEGDAARIISNLEVSSSNYKEAWKLLCERYDNKRILINHHLDSLFNVQTLTRESEKSLRFLVDHVTKNLRALSSLGQPTDHWDLLIIYILSSKLDNRTIVKWEEYRNTLNDVPSLEQFNKFLIDRADVLESLNRNKYVNNSSVPKQQLTPRPLQQTNKFQSTQNSYTKSNHFQNTKTFATTTQPPNQSKLFLCVVCNGNHRIYDCPIFKSKSIPEKMTCVSQYKLCANCLRQGHPISECRMGPCRQCNQRHNTLLHNPNVSVNYNINESQNEAVVAFSQQKTNHVLLSTAMINVCNPLNNKVERVRALLDSGSQSSFITKSLQQKLMLKCNPIDKLNVIGIGNNCSTKIVESCVTQFQSIQNTYQVTLSCYVLDDLTGDLPKAPIDIQNLKIPETIKLADPKFNEPAPIEVLIGADIFWDILGSEKRSLGPNNPKLQNSKLGWIIAGPIYSKYTNNKIQCNHAIITKTPFDQMLAKFWELEDLPQKKILSSDEMLCEKHFLNNTTRLSNGRFCVKLPLKDSPDCLGNSYLQAKKRFLNIEKRFRQNPQLKSQYTEFIREYAELGHLSESPVAIPNTSYFLCHHAVFKNDSETTKIRVVFDGSAPTTSGYSVNDILMIGPNMQDSLFSILLRARQYKYILTGDIAKMYRQVAVDENDRDLQLIL